VVTDRQLSALADTYDTCVVPGCAIRFGDCEIHHLWWWSLGGPTDLDLQVPLCRSHHTWVHEGGTSLTREDGRLVFRDPRGRTITNATQTLHDQLTLLHPPAPSECHAHAELILGTTTDTAGWPDSPTCTAAGAGPDKIRAHHPNTPHLHRHQMNRHQLHRHHRW
jgi:hypothetical protein